MKQTQQSNLSLLLINNNKKHEEISLDPTHLSCASHHADARELAALYVKSGIPIYPPCDGHAYHTLTWRMSVEGHEMEARNYPE